MKARYATTCAACARPVRVGEEIISTGKGGTWVHEACAQPVQEGLFTEGGGAAQVRKSVPSGARTGDGETEVFTDGACSGNPGPGGWAWAVADGRQGAGGHPKTTNQRMEIEAALEAVRTLDDSPLVVVSDSTYVVNCFRDGWWRGWRSRGWVTSAKKPVANRDLWEPLVDRVEERGDVTFRWVKGHSGDPMNDLVDRLAVEQSRAQRATS